MRHKSPAYVGANLYGMRVAVHNHPDVVRAHKLFSKARRANGGKRNSAVKPFYNYYRRCIYAIAKEMFPGWQRYLSGGY